MCKCNLFGSRAVNDAAMTARTLIALREFYDIRHVGNIGSDAVVQIPARWSRTDHHLFFTLCDNGGEINVEPINHSEGLRSVPFTSSRDTLTAETIAWRLYRAMTSQDVEWQKIDWDYNDIPGVMGKEPLRIVEKGGL